MSLTFFYSDDPETDPLSSAPRPDSGTGQASPLQLSSSTDTSAPASVATSAQENSSGGANYQSSAPTPQDVSSRLNESLRTLQQLADAQESPPDYRALASTCERILSLAAQVGDRDTQSRAQLDLGIALNKIGDFPRAAEALNRAVALGVETGDTRREMIARQSLGRALTMMGRTEQARIQFQRIAQNADFNERWRGLLSLGSLHEQQGQYQLAMQRFDEAATLLEEGETSRLADPRNIATGLLYINTNRRNVYLSGGDLVEARRLAETCLADAEALGIAEQNLEARLDMGWCDLFTGQWTQVYTGLVAMLQLARFVGDQGRETMARVGLGVFYAAAGDFDSAFSYGKDALSVALSRGDRLAELYAQLALADAYAGPADRSLEARYHANQALAITTSVNYARSEVECRLRLARINAQTGDMEGLLDAASRALSLAQDLGARHLESLAHVWLAETLLRTLLARTSGSSSANEGTSPTGEEFQRIRREAQSALNLAASTGFIESRWRAYDILGRLDLAAGEVQQAEEDYRSAINILESLRERLLMAGVPDTVLENADCQNVYVHLTQLLMGSERVQEAVTFLEQTGWPPLTARFSAALRVLPAPAEE